jgi:TRAP-type C4-dicarboxylate transport system permease small subunit
MQLENRELTSATTQAPQGAYPLLRRAIDAVDAVLVTVGSLMLFALMCVVVADVSLRYLFNAPLQWSYQVVSSYLMPGLFFMAVSHTLRSNSHVAVDILHNYVGPRTRYIFEAISSVLAVPVFALCTWVSAHNTWKEFLSGAESTSGLAVPSWTVSILLPIGFGMLTLRLALNAVGYIGTLASRRQLITLPLISGTEEGAE